jgi:hypothetical protein
MNRLIALRMWTSGTALTLAIAVPTALAGPPLLCHEFEVGNAQSLPWSAAGAPLENYNKGHLAIETVSLLTGQTPVIVRMETIRRAALYCAGDASLAQTLLERFKMRAAGDGAHSALPLFDYGYLIETLKQAVMMRELQNASAAVKGLDGYTLIKQALQIRDDPEMEFAAALVTVWPKNEDHREHFRKAVAGAAVDPLLAKNLLEQFSGRGKTLAALRTY